MIKVASSTACGPVDNLKACRRRRKLISIIGAIDVTLAGIGS
jgi:hypothetical protein